MILCIARICILYSTIILALLNDDANDVQERWEAKLATSVGPEYEVVRSHTLAAIHIMIFARRALIPYITGFTEITICIFSLYV